LKVPKIIYLFFLLLSFVIYSCESNDDIVIRGSSNIGATNKALVELFTNTSCVPCVPANILLDGITKLSGVTNNDTNVVIIRYHSTLFPNDPYYNFNPADNFARQQYYNAGISNPRGFLMGTSMGGFNATNWTNAINTKLATVNPFGINFTLTYDSVANSGTLNIQVTQAGGSQQSDMVLHIAVAEDGLIMNPPAPNGEIEFENTFRDFITPAEGESFTIIPGQSLSFIENFSIMSGINIYHTNIIVFVQNTVTKEIFGVLKKKLI